MTPLKTTDKNFNLLREVSHFSCSDWARFALSLDRNPEKDGFRNYYSGDWMNFINYKYIDKEYPVLSKPEAIDEMIYYKQKLKEEIINNAKEIDNMLMRLAKMEEETNRVIKQKQIDSDHD